MWYTSNSTITSTCLYGDSNNTLIYTAIGSSNTYGDNIGYHHNVLLDNLKYDQDVYYTCGDKLDGFSNVYHVKTASIKSDSFTVAIIGDMGVSNSNGTMEGLLRDLDLYNFAIHIGDISYADERTLDQYEAIWNEFMDLIQPIATTKPYMVLPGNHEADCSDQNPTSCPSNFLNFSAYLTRFRMPYAESGGVNNMWYSFDYGLAHFVIIDTETDYHKAPEGEDASTHASGPFGDQASWFQNDLAQASKNRANRPWIIVIGHRPIYASRKVVKDLGEWVEPLLLQYNVDFYINGHEHMYERMWPVSYGNLLANNYKSPQSPVYICNGAAGNIQGHDQPEDTQPASAFLNDQTYGYGYISIIDAHTAKWSFISSTTLAVIDSITVTK